MKHYIQKATTLSRSSLYLLSAFTLASVSFFNLFSSQKVYAAQITDRSLTLSSSSAASGNATTSYTFDLTVPTTGTIVKSVSATICTTASGGCSSVTGFSNSSSTIDQPTGLGDTSGWTVSTATSGSLRLTNTTNSATPSGSQQIVFHNVQNPTTPNQTFFARVVTYSDDAWTTSIDSGVVAASTAQQIALSGNVDETLVFCTGTSITGEDCGTVSGSAVNFGTFSSTATSSGTSVMAASTNGLGGYSITVNGGTLTCSTCVGTPTIAALASQTASSTGTAQFGLNLRDNATPNVGLNPTGSGSGSYTANYGTVDQFRFVTADSVASAANASNANKFTVSYIVNIPGAQPAGVYTATMTYICTATF